MNCPKCGEKLDSFLYFLIRPGFSSRYCPACNSKLELLNPGTGIFISGITFVVLIFILMFSEMPYLFFWVILLSLLCCVINAGFNSLFGRYIIWSYTDAQQQKRQRLAVEEIIAYLSVSAWVLYMILSIYLPYVEIFANADGTNAMLTSAEKFTEMIRDRILSPRGMIELAFGIGSVTWVTANTYRRSSLKAKAKKSPLDMS